MSNLLKLSLFALFLMGCAEITSSTPSSSNNKEKTSPAPIPPLNIEDIPLQPQEQIIILEQ